MLVLSGINPGALTPSVCQALAKVTTLKELECDSFTTAHDEDGVPADAVPAQAGFVEAVGTLEHLTRLSLPVASSSLSQLPGGLKSLLITAYEGPEELRVLDLARLTNLTSLECTLQEQPMTALLPLQLQALKAYGCLHLGSGVPALTVYTTGRDLSGLEVAPSLRLRGLQQPLSMAISVSEML